MEMFLWTVGSFHVFGEKLDLTCVFKSKSSFLRKHRSRVHWLDAKFHHGEPGKRLLCFFEKGFYMLEKGVYFSEITICRCM